MKIINKIFKFFNSDYRIIKRSDLEQKLIEIYKTKVSKTVTKEKVSEEVQIIYKLPRSKAERKGLKVEEELPKEYHTYKGKKVASVVNFPCRSGKKCYKGKKSADKAAKMFGNFKKGSKDRQRNYKCWDCPYWHLTSN